MIRVDHPTSEDKSSCTRMFLPTLVFCTFSTGPLAVLVGLFLYPMAKDFSVEVGIMGQISTFSSATAVAIALLMGLLSVRFKHKSLLVVGLVFFGISSAGCFLSADFNLMLLSYSISGIGLAMVTPMTSALIGELYPLEKRAKAIAWIVGAGALPYVISPPLLGVLAGYGGWRLTLLWFIIPISLMGIVLAVAGIPSASTHQKQEATKRNYLESFKKVLSCKSALACLAGDILRTASFAAILFYGSAFFMQRFEASTDLASIILLSAASFYTLGSLTSSTLVNRIGRKTSAALTALIAGIFTVSFVYATNIWLSVLLNFIAAWFFGMVTAAANGLALEQVPECRGTMMSIDTAFVNIGYSAGAAIGGITLIWYGYQGLGTALGATGIAAAFIFYLLTSDPTRTRSTSAEFLSDH